jgi:hypothetical protein
VREDQVVWETPGVTVSETTEAERKAAGARAPAAELEGALKVIRALGERIVERVNQNYLRLYVLEQDLRKARLNRRRVNARMCALITEILETESQIAAELRKFPELETIWAHPGPDGDVLALDESIEPGRLNER